MGKYVRVIFDNGGGVTLQLGDDYGHYYDNPEQAAEDYKAYMRDGNTDGWDGNEDYSRELDPSYDEIRNGGYKIMDADDIQQAIDDPDFESAWYNIDDFIKALKG